ncbi:hypothetical protein B0T25DRAFT_535690 [Lasiosphaeria hispida]|uniref:Nephrocystin 3-like N-terminal domain-containing protein n=1 Tax=Lasiosphaeria hispida TaxID=260671 RepID=A0AAJ0HSJ0_9PEZI|nr:hypothetical protein B0T25DRAFT_535690 [Lasiosphaeria hispida]
MSCHQESGDAAAPAAPRRLGERNLLTSQPGSATTELTPPRPVPDFSSSSGPHRPSITRRRMSTPDKAKTYRARQLPCILTSLGQVASFLAGVVPGLAADDVRVFSLATSLNPLEIPATKVATLMFDRVPPMFDNSNTEWIISGQSAGLVRDLLIDVHFRDFTPLNDAPPENHMLDCIALSGLASHPFGSWKQRGSRTSFMWLRDRLPRELPHVRSIIYGYDTALLDSESVKGVNDIAIALIAKMKSIGRSSPASRPLVILAHSLGGIVVKQAMAAMARASESTGDMLESVRRVIFFGVPNRGMQISHLLPMVHDRPNNHLTQLLSTESDYLEELDHQFSGILEHRGIDIMSVYETKRSETTQKNALGEWTRGGPKELLVDKSSAIQRKSSLYLPVDEDHSNMVKFGADDQDCQAILRFILDSHTTDPESSAKSTKSASTLDGEIGPDTREEHQRKLRRVEVMRSSLHVSETSFRLRDIQGRHELTFEWIFSDRSIGFTEWLKGAGKVFWISGKPGCGKSTIMKLVRNDNRTQKLIMGSHKSFLHSGVVGMADFFFHDRGSTVQKSIEGMLSRILYQLLEDTIPFSVAELMLPIWERLSSGSRRADRTWTLDSLRQALDVVLTQQRTPILLLLFLDALDEFDGEPQVIADFVQDLTRPRVGSCTEIKVCCSSRPWNVFRDTFSDLAGCRVHEHTRHDIQLYIDGRFEANLRMREMMARGSRGSKKTVQTLKTTLSERAEGVFVWVRLVVDELLRACTDGSIPEELLELLSSIPADLDKTYQRLIDRIPLEYRFESYVFFEVVMRNQYLFGLRDLGLTMLCALGKSPAESAEKLPSDPFSEDFLAATRRRLQSRCGGMLEVLEDTTVQFMHQTAKEFFSRPGTSEAILQHEPKLCVENGFSFITKFYLTLGSARCDSFNWRFYLLSRFRNRGRDIDVRYQAGTRRVMKHVSRIVDLSTSNDRFLHLMDYATFQPLAMKNHCMFSAYQSENTTGRSLRGFLSQTTDEAIRSMFSWIPASARSKRHCNSVKAFAREADLHLFLEESGIPLAKRRRPRREPERPRPGFARQSQFAPIPARPRPAPPPQLRVPEQQRPGQEGRYRQEWESPRTRPNRSPYPAYESAEDGAPGGQPPPRYSSPGPQYYYPSSREPLAPQFPMPPDYYRGYSSHGQPRGRYPYRHEPLREEYWDPPSSGRGDYYHDW